MLALSFPYAGIFAAAWIALVPVLFVIGRTDRTRSFLGGLTAGIGGYAGIFYWLYPMLLFNTGSVVQALVCLFLLSAYLGLFIAVWSWLSRIVYEQAPGRGMFVVITAALWVSLEYLRTYLFTGFPWALLGYSQWNFLPLAQVAEYTGVYGVSFLLVLLSGAVSIALIDKRWPRVLTAVLAALVLLAGLGAVRRPQLSKNGLPAAKFAVLQPNIDQYKKWDAAFENEILQTYADMSLFAAKTSPDVIVWPETGVPGYLPYSVGLLEWARRVTERTGTYNIIGTPYYAGGTKYFNSTALFSSSGTILAWHMKTHLVPFGEYVPFRKYLAPYFGVLNSLGDFTRSTDATLFISPKASIGATICSENFFGTASRRFAKEGATVLVNQTNDAWFFKTAAAEQHFIMNVFRAIETRKPVVVSGNTGVSGIIDASGTIIRKTPLFKRSVFTADVIPRKGSTFYVRFGDIFAYLCVLLSIFVLVRANRNRRPG
jgi:apolipoprotein N-acyltransferase